MALGFYLDATRCIGCRNIQAPGARPRRVESFETGTYPQVGMFHLSVGCNHCDDPACVANCPTLAMHKTSDGIVLHDDARCVQCKNCMTVCPYGAPQWDADAQMIVKCDSCYDLRKAGMNPTCVDACPTRALKFGDIDELRREYGSDCVSELPVLGSADRTHPNLLVRPSDVAANPAFTEVVL